VARGRLEVLPAISDHADESRRLADDDREGAIMSSSPQDVTKLLADCSQGNQDALAKLLPLVYEELRRLASSYLKRERVGHTLQATALVHEAYLRLVDQRSVQWQNRGHFFAVAAQAMRRILVNHAVSRGRQKRGGGHARVSLEEPVAVIGEQDIDLVALDEALHKLANLDQRKSQLVELRFFDGLSAEEAGEVLGVSLATVKREWDLAKAWLRREVEKGE